MQFVGTNEKDSIVDLWRDESIKPPTPSQPWVGTTEFTLKPLDEELRTAKMTWEDGERRTMTRGQQRRLTKEVIVMEDEDVALWSTLRKQRVPLPKGWRAMLEFAGCAVLTSVFQAAGYTCSTPLDLLGGWDVHCAAHREMAEKVIFTENPYLLTWAFPCGPWSPWQRLQPEETTNAKRRRWIPVFSWMYRTIRKHKARGGRTLLENPWLSEAWNTAEIQMILKLGLEIVRIDMCRFGLKNKENGMAHRKMTCVATDLEEILGVLRGMTCRGDHEHQPLEGRNCYGPRCAQAARYTVEFCRRILRGFQKDLGGGRGRARHRGVA